MINQTMLHSFHLAGQDFLELLAKKSKQAEKNTEAAKELETLNTFYEFTIALLQKGEIDMYQHKLEAITEHFKAKIMEAELRAAYNALHKTNQIDTLNQLMKSTALLSKKQLTEEVGIKP
jgi:Ni,Fe-hydrogenase I large subunit